MQNPEERFVVKTITRKAIAEALNYVLEQYCDSDVRLADDDDRLTFAICCKYASEVPTDFGNPSADWQETLVGKECLQLMGIIENDPDLAEHEDENAEARQQLQEILDRQEEDEKSLDHLIYDGMGQVLNDGTVRGSVRP